MALTLAQQTIWEKAHSLGAGGQAVALTEEACLFLLATIVADLGLATAFPELPRDLPPFFSSQVTEGLAVPGSTALPLFERLVVRVPDADTYFSCLAWLHKARLKYHRILTTQPIPTLEQVGPRGLLQHGTLGPKALVGWLLWRKWFFDIDNRAGQETGYLFEPIIAASIGGTPVPASKSPIKRRRNRRKGRQVDCLKGERAYEFKLRVTIAASGQGRWQEELDFPADCRASRYVPVLVVLDSTKNQKLSELTKAFLKAKGEVYVGQNAWDHFEGLAGPTMSKFLEKYLRAPMEALLPCAMETLPRLSAEMTEETMRIAIGDESFTIHRGGEPVDEEQEESGIPDDTPDQTPGV